MLERLERSPLEVFSQTELKTKFPDDFEQSRTEGLLRMVCAPPGPGDTNSYVGPSGNTLVVVPVSRAYEAFDDEDPEAEPIRLTGEDLVQWTLDLEAFSQQIQQAKELTGLPEELEPRLWFLGSKEYDGMLIGYLLGFLDGSPATLILLE